MSSAVYVLSTLSDRVLSPLRTSTLPYLPLPILSLLHATRITLEYRRQLAAQGHQPPTAWLQGLIATCIMALGGTTLASILCGIPPPWVASNTVLPAYALVYFLVFQFPSDRVFSLLNQYAFLIDPLLIGADGVARSMAQCIGGVDMVRAHPLLGPEKYVAQIILGTLAGTGGGLLADAFVLSAPTWHFRLPTAFKSPTIDLKTAFSVAVTYTILTSEELMQQLMYLMQLQGKESVQVMGQEEARVVCALLFSSALIYKRYGSSWSAFKLGSKTIAEKKEESKLVVSQEQISDKKE